MGKQKDDRLRRLAGGPDRLDPALSAAMAQAIRAQRHECRDNALAAVLGGYADVYVEGIHDNGLLPEGLAPEWARNGSLHAWCRTKEGQLVDPTLNAYTHPEMACVLHEYHYMPLAALTRGELVRAIARTGVTFGEERFWTLIDALVGPYTLPEGVAGWQNDDEIEARSAAAVAEAEQRAREQGLL